MKFIFFIFCLLLIGCLHPSYSFAQQGTTINLKNDKPAKYSKDILPAEKTGYGKVKGFKKITQNLFTRYNYLFNSNKKFEQIMAQAKASNKDDYSHLLKFYPYDEKSLAKNNYFDTVIHHATAGLLLHDLRNEYVDELYFLMGKSYFLSAKYDTAQQVFQYLNYAFAPKDGGYDLPIGSNISNQKIFTIVSKERKEGESNEYNNANRRNDALLWLTRCYILKKEYAQAAALLNYLHRDAYFPQRLKPLFYETKAYYFYTQKYYDSAAVSLAECQFTNDSKEDIARRYFLTAQLYQASNNDSDALSFFDKAREYTLNPLMEINAQMYVIQLRSTLSNESNNQIETLDKLAKKEKYNRYKDLIYYSEARAINPLKQPQLSANLLLKSIEANRQNQPRDEAQRSQSFLALGNIHYNLGSFVEASNSYDSVSANYITDSIISKQFQLRKPVLNQFAENSRKIFIQDSLQSLAKMPAKERLEFLKQAAKKIRRSIDKLQSAKSDNNNNNIASITQNNGSSQPSSSLFDTQNAEDASLWYFNNATLKSKGYNLFKQKFGNRPNVDNWQRLSAIDKNAANNSMQPTNDDALAAFNSNGTLKIDSSNITAEDLLAGLPLTKEKQGESDKIIAASMLDNGKLLENKLENFSGAIPIYDTLINQYPDSKLIPEALYNLFICYRLSGQKDKAAIVKNKLDTQYKESKWQKLLDKNAIDELAKSPSSEVNQATKLYSKIYDLFLEGKFVDAIHQKDSADKLYGNFYWTPQLLYIEALYKITLHQDTVAISKLNYIIKTFATSPIAKMSKHVIIILERRKQVEDYLRSLHISPDDYLRNNTIARLENTIRQMDNQNSMGNRIGLIRNKDIVQFNQEDSIETLHGTLNESAKQIALADNEVVKDSSSSEIKEQELPKEIVNANSSSTIKQQETKKEIAKISEHSAKDSVHNNQPVVNIPKEIPKKKKELQSIDGFNFSDQSPRYVVILMHDVAPVFANEAGNAFNRYNLLSFPNKTITVNAQKIDDYNLVLIGPFKNKEEAQQYQSAVEPNTANTIIPWLTADKYIFTELNPTNAEKIKSATDMEKYLKAKALYDKE